MRFVVKKGFLVRDIAGEHVLIGGGEQINFSKMLMLNDTAVWVITRLQEGAASAEELARRLTDEYDVTLAEALADVNGLLKELKGQGVVTEEE